MSATRDQMTGPQGGEETLPGLEPVAEGQELELELARERTRGALFGGAEAPVRLDRFVVLGRLGSGGMGVVYAAFDPELDRKVAVKVVRTAGGGAQAVARRRKRLMVEARAMARVSHPNVAQVFEVGTLADGEVFLVMEFVVGCTLRRWSETPRNWRDVVDVFLAAGRGLAAAHAEGLVHRDFKPENVMVDDDGRVRVMDFGLVRASEDEEVTLDLGAGSSMITRSGALMGTPAYMAPEQFEGAVADARADQFGFCVALHEALYGRRPFAAQTVAELALAVTEGKIEAPSGAGAAAVPARLHRVIARGLARVPNDRWPSIGALLVQLERSRVAGRRRMQATITAIGIGGLAALAGAWISTDDPCPREREAFSAWGPDAKDALASHFAGLDAPFVAVTAQSVEERLSAYAQAWLDERRAACMATRVAGNQSDTLLDRRMRCLDRRAGEVSQLVTALLETDVEAAARGIDAVAALVPPSRCGDPDLLDADIAAPSGEIAGEVATLHVQLARARALGELGRYAAARDVLEPVVARARELAYAPLLAEALETLGGALDELGDPAAATAFEDAYFVARGANDDEVSSRTAAQFATGLMRESRLDEALRWVRIAEVEAPDEGTLLVAANARGYVLYKAGRPAEALVELERSLAMVRSVFGEHAPDTAVVLGNVASTLSQLGRYDEALVRTNETLELEESIHGPDHPRVAMTLKYKGDVLYGLGRHKEAVMVLERGLSIFERTLGSEHLEVSHTTGTLASALRNLGDLPRAREMIERSIRILERSLGPTHPDLAAARGELALLLDAEGDPEAAIVELEKTRAILVAGAGPEHSWLGAIDTNLGNALGRVGRNAEAEAAYRRAIALWAADGGDKDPRMQPTLVSLAILLCDAGRADEALVVAEQGAAIPTEDVVVGARAVWSLGRALVESGRDAARGLALAVEARTWYATTETRTTARTLASMDRWLRTHGK